MTYKLVNKSTIGGNIFEPNKNSGQRVELTKVTSRDLYAGLTITSLDVSSTAFDMKSGDKINIGGQLLTLDADAAATATSLSVSSTELTFDVELNATIEIDNQNLFVQYQRKTEGSIGAFAVGTNGLTKKGIEITDFLDDDTFAGANDNSLATSESIKAYVDSKAPVNYVFATSSGTGLTSATNGIANAVAVPFDTSAVTSSGTITLNGASGVSGVADSEYSFSLDANTASGVYEIGWNIAVDLSVVVGRYLCGVTLETGLAVDSTTMTWAEVSPSRSWIYVRGTTGNRYGSAANSIVYDLDAETDTRIFRVVFWKQDGAATGKLITEINGCSVTIKQL